MAVFYNNPFHQLNLRLSSHDDSHFRLSYFNVVILSRRRRISDGDRNHQRRQPEFCLALSLSISIA